LAHIDKSRNEFSRSTVETSDGEWEGDSEITRKTLHTIYSQRRKIPQKHKSKLNIMVIIIIIIITNVIIYIPPDSDDVHYKLN